MQKLCKIMQNYTKGMQKLCNVRGLHNYACIMQKVCKLCKNYANYASLQKLCKLCIPHFADEKIVAEHDLPGAHEQLASGWKEYLDMRAGESARGAGAPKLANLATVVLDTS